MKIKQMILKNGEEYDYIIITNNESVITEKMIEFNYDGEKILVNPDIIASITLG